MKENQFEKLCLSVSVAVVMLVSAYPTNMAASTMKMYLNLSNGSSCIYDVSDTLNVRFAQGKLTVDETPYEINEVLGFRYVDGNTPDVGVDEVLQSEVYPFRLSGTMLTVTLDSPGQVMISDMDGKILGNFFVSDTVTFDLHSISPGMRIFTLPNGKCLKLNMK